MGLSMETAETKPTAPTDYKTVAKDWLASLDSAEETRKEFLRRGRKINKRYRSESARSGSVSSETKFNLFWANVQTLAPATYARRPKVEVFRRFRDEDPAGRLAGLMLERALQYEVDKGLTFHNTMKNVVLDRLLPGLGAAWVRYEPSFKKEMQPLPSEDGLSVEEKEVEVLADEVTPVDYVHWESFLTSPARTWADVTWVAREVPFTKEALKTRFEETIAKLGGNLSQVNTTNEPTAATSEDGTTKTKDEATDPALQRALVWEIWDKAGKQIIFVAKGCETPLDIVNDPADLDEFWPCPPPMLATTTTDQLLPVPDYVIYQGQLRELDKLTLRISLLQDALKVVGVYDASQDALKDLLRPGSENKMIPVNAWAAFAEKGGLKGVTDFLPLETVAKVLEGLYVAREGVKQTIYEITGMADIIRGASVASETLGAQQIKAKFANLRLSSRQQQVAEFVTHVLSIKAQLICKHYSPQTLIRISSAEQLEEVKAHPERLQEAIALLKDDRTRSYRIEVQAESMLELDEVDEQERRNQFMSTVSNFFLAAKNIAATAPEMMPVALEMLKFAIRGFPVGRGLESALEDASEGIKKRMAQPPQPPQPDPTERMKLEAGAALEKMRQEGETARTQMDNQVKLQIAQLEQRFEALQADMARQHEQRMAQVQGLQEAVSAHREAQTAFATREHENQLTREQEAQTAIDQQQDQALQRLQEADTKILESLQALIEEIGKPRRKTPTYGPSGEIEYVDEAPIH